MIIDYRAHFLTNSILGANFMIRHIVFFNDKMINYIAFKVSFRIEKKVINYQLFNLSISPNATYFHFQLVRQFNRINFMVLLIRSYYAAPSLNPKC